MKKTGVIMGLMIIGILILSGCTQQQTTYVCPDGTTVTDKTLCKEIQCQVYAGAVCVDKAGRHELSEEEYSFCKDNSVYELTYQCMNNACDKVLHKAKDCSSTSSITFTCGYEESDAPVKYKRYATCKLKS